MILTPALLRAATGCSQFAADLYAEHLAEACQRHGIDSDARLSAFLAQVGHESVGLRHVREIWGPTDAQKRYEGRKDLGNVQPGDGERFKGRGLIQLTGRENYARMRGDLARIWAGVPDFEAQPETLEQPVWACRSAAAFWYLRGCNELADAEDFEGLTRKINGGLNGIEDRRKRWAQAKAALGIAAQPTKEKTMPLPLAPILAAVLPSIVEAIPKLGKIFGSGSEVAERNIKAAELVVEAVKDATGAVNAQEAAEKLRDDPAAVAAATKAIDGIWFEISSEAAPAAKAAEAAFLAAGYKPWQSPSMWALLALLPLAYMVVGSVVGLWGSADWSPDVRAAISTAVVSLIIGGAAGYYWGATTSRNRPADPGKQ